MKILKLISVLFLSTLALGQASITLGGVGSVSGLIVTVSPNLIAVRQTAMGDAQTVVNGSPNNDVTWEGTWTSLSPSIATVSPFGLVTAVSAGTATIQFSIGITPNIFTQTASVQVGNAPIILQGGMTGCPSACIIAAGGTTSGFSYTFVGSGGTPPYTWSIDATTSTCLSGSGLSFNSAGLWAGASPIVGTYTCLFDITDSQMVPITTSLSVSVTITGGGGSSCGPPNYPCAYTGLLIIPQPLTPNVSTSCTVNGVTTSCNNNATVTDTSFATYGGIPTANLSTATRCTDPRSAQDEPNFTFSAGEGGSGEDWLINTNSTLARISDTGGHGFITSLVSGVCTKPSGASAGLFITKNLNTINPGSSTSTQDFGGGGFTLNDPTKYMSAGTNTDVTNPMWITPYVINVSTGAFTPNNVAGVVAPLADFTNALPVGASSPEWQPGTSYGFGKYIKHTLAPLSGGTTSNLSPSVGASSGTNPWANLSNAYDGNPASYSQGGDSGALLTPTSATWSGFPAAGAGATSITLNVNLQTLLLGSPTGTFSVQYSLNSGSSFTTFPGTPTSAATPQTTYSVALPTSQNMTQVQVKASVAWTGGGVTLVSMRMYEIYATVVTGSGSGGEYLKWTAGTTYNSGDIIVPGDSDGNTTNPQACAFKATFTSPATSGASGGSLPNFQTKSPCVINSVTDGAVKWKGLGSQAVFTMQNISTPTGTGKSCTSNLTWYNNAGVISHPVMGTTITDCNGIVWQNQGPNYAPTVGALAWAAWAGVSVNQNQVASAFSTNTYGVLNCNHTDCFTPYEAGQGSGIWLTMASTSDPVTSKPTYYLLNTQTGIQTNFTCGTGTLGACGSLTAATWGTSAYNAIGAVPIPPGGPNPVSPCPYLIHNEKMLTDGTGVRITNQVNFNSVSGCNNTQGFQAWQPVATFNANSGLQFFADGLNHESNGNTHYMGFHNCGYGQNFGSMICIYPQTNVSGNNGVLTTPFVDPPYSYSIAGTCSTAIGTGNNLGYSAAITVATESSFTVTITSGVIPPVGALVRVNDISPSGYNGTWVVTANTSSTFSYTNTTSGLGAGTSFGTWNNGIAMSTFGTLPNGYFATNAGSPSCSIAAAYDSHLNWTYNPGQTDSNPVGGTVYNLATLSPVPFSAFQNEEVAFPTSPVCPIAGQASCSTATPVGTLRRFFHTFATGTNPTFNIQFQISQGSQDGTVIMWSSDWNCTLGPNNTGQPGSITGTGGVPVQDGSGQLGHLPVTSYPTGVGSFCGTPWQPSYTYFLGELISPIKGTSGGGTQYDVFQVVARTTGISGSGTQPGFATSLPPTAAFTVTAATVVGTTATITTATNTKIAAGQKINVTGMTPSGYNCSACVVASVTTAVPWQIVYTTTVSGSGTGFGSVFGIGSQIVDNGVTWQDVGPNDARGDAFVTVAK